jgi:hypothetical protein
VIVKSGKAAAADHPHRRGSVDAVGIEQALKGVDAGAFRRRIGLEQGEARRLRAVHCVDAGRAGGDCNPRQRAALLQPLSTSAATMASTRGDSTSPMWVSSTSI